MLKKLLFLSAIGISGIGNDRPMFIKVVCFADAEKQEKANMDAQFASARSEVFTAVLMMQAVEEKDYPEQ